jgi:hypothetical protein
VRRADGRGAVAVGGAGRIRLERAEEEPVAAGGGGSGGGAGGVVRGGADDGADGVGVRAGVGDFQLRILCVLESGDVDAVRATREGEGCTDAEGGGVDIVVVDEEVAVEEEHGPEAYG